MNTPHPRIIAEPRDGFVITADASKISPAEFMRMVWPKPKLSRVEQLCEQLWTAAQDNDRARIREIHAEMKSLPPELNPEARAKWL